MQAFWVGKVIGVDAGEGKVKLQRWHTGTVDNLNLDKAAAKYRVWTGSGPKTEWIEITRVLEVFDLTPKGSSVSKLHILFTKVKFQFDQRSKMN